MRSLRIQVAAAAIALLTLAAPAFTQVSDYHQIKTPQLRTFSMPQPKRIELSNGMVIFLQENHELPLIDGRATIRGGSRDVAADKAGLVSILSQSWRTGGTQSRTGDELDQFLESKAARVETTGGEDSTGVVLSVLKGDFDTVFPIFAEIMQKPAFRQEKIDLAKTQMRTAISRRNDDPGSIVGREAGKLGYGADSPYARVPEYATISAITRDDLVKFHDRFVQPNNIIMGFVGDFDSAAMEKKLRAAFGSWKRGQQAPPAPAVGPSAKPGVYYVAKDDVTQANIAMVHSGGPLRKDPDSYAITVMNEILSGGFSGRLMNNIRSKAGLAYGVGGGLGLGWERPTLLTVSLATKSPSVIDAIGLVKQEVSDLQTKPFTPEELKLAKDSILNAFVFTMDSKAKIINQRMMLEFYGYPADYWQRYQAGIQAVTADDVARVAKKYVHPDQLAVLVVGNEKDFPKPLASAFGSVTPIDVTIPEPGAPAKPAGASTPSKAAAPAAPAASSADALALAGKVRDFVGGKEKVTAVQATHTVSTATMKGPQGDMEVEIDSTFRYPDSQRRVMKTPMGEITTVLAPSAAYMITPMGTQDLPSSQRDAAKSDLQLEMLAVLKNLENPAYTFAITGTEKVGDVNAQVLSVTAGGTSLKWYVDPATGKVLRVGRTGRMGEQFTDYTEYKTFAGLTMPAAFTVTVNGEKSGSGTMKSLEVNPAIDAKAFEKPEAK